MLSILSRMIDRRIAAYQHTLIATHYAEVETMHREIRGRRHDWRNHIQLLKVYAQAGDLPAILSYLDAMDADLSSIDTTIKTGNRMTDAILSSKISLARAKGVQVAADAQIATALTTPELDLCIIIGNLLDNAIEANLPLPRDRRMIRILMDMKGTQLYLCVTNMTAGGKQRKVGGRFRTTKGEGHGFGLLRIDTIVERHGGYINRNSEEGAFTTEILLPQ